MKGKYIEFVLMSLFFCGGCFNTAVKIDKLVDSLVDPYDRIGTCENILKKE